MERSTLKILIVEDDIHLGKTLTQAMKEAGFQASFTPKSDSALLLAKKEKWHCIVADCLLPKTDGIQLVRELKKIHKDIRSILITGVYKNKSFFQDALTKTGSYDLLMKPFKEQDLILTIEHLFSDLLTKKRKLSLELFTHPQLKEADIKKTLLDEKNFPGLELPYIYSLFFQSQLTGILNLNYKNKSISSIQFKKGEIIDIQLKDEKSYFGVLLVENGFISHEELEKALKIKGQKPLGEELVDVNMLSPHIIKMVQKQQACIRLSKTIRDEALSVQFIEEPELSQKPEEPLKNQEDPSSNDTLLNFPIPPFLLIEQSQFPKLLSEWILSKIKTDVLKSFYVPWSHHVLAKSPSFSHWVNFKSLPVLKSDEDNIEKLINLIEKENSLSHILESYKNKNSFPFKALYFLLIYKFLYFKEVKNISFDEKKELKELKEIFQDLKKKNYFELFGISKNATFSDIAKAYYHFANFLHPEKISVKGSKEFKILSHKVFSHILSAYNTLRDEKSRTNYLKQIEQMSLKRQTKAEATFDKALSLMKSHQYSDAYKILEHLREEKLSIPEFMIHYIWAFIKSEKYKFMLSEKDLIPYLGSMMNEVPAEERHNSNYFYVMSLIYTLSKKYHLAQKYLKHALTLNPEFSIAKQDLDLHKKNVLKKD